MTLLILESLGTPELVMVGLVALIVFGPRRLPELARKAGKIMFDLRKMTDEFKNTWLNEVQLDEDEKDAFNFSDESISRKKIKLVQDNSDDKSKEKEKNKDEHGVPITSQAISEDAANLKKQEMPSIRNLDAAEFEKIRNASKENNSDESQNVDAIVTKPEDKVNWL